MNLLKQQELQPIHLPLIFQINRPVKLMLQGQPEPFKEVFSGFRVSEYSEI